MAELLRTAMFRHAQGYAIDDDADADALRNDLQRPLIVEIELLLWKRHSYQPGSAVNCHCRRRKYHMIVAILAGSSEVLVAQLRPGKVQPTDSGTNFILELLNRVDGSL